MPRGDLKRMTETSEIEGKLLGFLRREVFAPDVTLDAESDLLALGFDSMSLVRLMLFVENTYGFWLPEGEINTNTLRSVRTLSALVHRVLHAR